MAATIAVYINNTGAETIGGPGSVLEAVTITSSASGTIDIYDGNDAGDEQPENLIASFPVDSPVGSYYFNCRVMRGIRVVVTTAAYQMTVLRRVALGM